MQLLIITTVREYENHIPLLFQKAGIHAFSSTNINGFKSSEAENLMANWFSSARNQVESNIFFTFTSPDLIDQLLELIKEFNITVDGQNPIHAIVLDIDKFVN
jgi:hypothetical protein